jgi:hypothetical protein
MKSLTAKFIAINLFISLFLIGCSSVSDEGVGLNRRVVSPTLASVRSVYVSPVVCKAAGCPSELSSYQKGVERAVKQRSDFSLGSSATSADAEIIVTLRSVQERSGSSWGSDTGAGVSYDIVLNKDGREIWRDVAAARDEALSENILNIKEAKFNWVTTAELFGKQVGLSLQRLSRDRQGLFTKN